MIINKFERYEIVVIQPKNGLLEYMSEINAGEDDYQALVGKEGVVLGMTESDDGSEIFYLVTFDHMDESAAFIFREKDLVSTGKMVKESDIMSGESIKVRVDPGTREGWIVDEDDIDKDR